MSHELHIWKIHELFTWVSYMLKDVVPSISLLPYKEVTNCTYIYYEWLTNSTHESGLSTEIYIPLHMTHELHIWMNHTLYISVSKMLRDVVNRYFHSHINDSRTTHMNGSRTLHMSGSLRRHRALFRKWISTSSWLLASAAGRRFCNFTNKILPVSIWTRIRSWLSTPFALLTPT